MLAVSWESLMSPFIKVYKKIHNNPKSQTQFCKLTDLWYHSADKENLVLHSEDSFNKNVVPEAYSY